MAHPRLDGRRERVAQPAQETCGSEAHALELAGAQRLKVARPCAGGPRRFFRLAK